MQLDPVAYQNNTIYSIFLMPPNKAAALAYLDAGGPPPRRSAQAIVIRGALASPDVMAYKVTCLRIHKNLLIGPQGQVI